MGTHQPGRTGQLRLLLPELLHLPPLQIRAPSEVIYPPEVDNTTRPGGEDGWWTWGPVLVQDEKMADYHVVDWARYQLSQKHDQPFFLAVGLWKPHDPWEVPQKYFDMYPLEDIVLPEIKEDDLEDAFDHGRRWIHQWVVDNQQWEKVVQSYAASITFTDAMLGRLLDAFENSEHMRWTPFSGPKWGVAKVEPAELNTSWS